MQRRGCGRGITLLYDYDLSSLKADETGGQNVKSFNIVGKDEIDNLQLAQFIAETQNKELIYEMVDFHSQRPGHDLRYDLTGAKMAKMGWEPGSVYDKIKSTIKWTLKNVDG